jgi:hypothetical protein
MKPWFGLHLPSYTHPDTPPAQLFDRVVETDQIALLGDLLRMVAGG